MKKLNLLMAICGLALFTSTASAIELTPAAGWGSGNDWDNAVKYAQKKNLPVAVVYTFKETTCPKCIGATKSYMSDKATKGMAAVMLTTDDNVSQFNEIRRKVTNGDDFLPKLYIVDPEMNLLAYSEYGDTRTEFHAAANRAREIMSWKVKVAKRAKDAEKAAERGSYSKAVELIEKSIDEDRKLTHRLDTMFTKSKEAIATAATDKKENDEEEALPAAGRFFPDMMTTARTRFDELAASRLADGKKAIDEKDYIVARRVLTPMARDTSDFPQVAEAKELLAKLDAMQKAEREAEKKAVEDKREQQAAAN